MSTIEPQTPQLYEETHVHGVYDAIAPHFSATRHKPWPFVSSFLASLPPGSVGFDVGCGNGKNMGVNRDVVMLGCDRSAALVALARGLWCRPDTRSAPDIDHHRAIPGADVAVADGLDLPFRDASADFVICIAVVHHLSTRERRIDAIRQLLRCVRRNKPDNDCSPEPSSSVNLEPLGGRVLVYVWALEQSSSRRGWDQGNDQDLLVPWVMKAPQQKKPKKLQPPKYRKKNHGLQPADCAGEGHVLSGGESGEDMQGRRQQSHGKQGCGGGGHDDAAAVPGQGDAAVTADADAAAAASELSRRQSSGHNAEDMGGKTIGDGQPQPQPHTNKDKTFHRYYHLYKKGELEEDVLAAGGQVLRSGYERDNWWVVAG